MRELLTTFPLALLRLMNKTNLRSLRGRSTGLLWLSWFSIVITSVGCHSFCCPTLPHIPRLGIFRKPIPAPFFEAHKYSLFTSPQLTELPPRRVVIVPTGTELGRYQAPAHFAESLAAAMRAEGVCEVVSPPQAQCNTTVDGILTGQFDERELIDLARTWHCDAVMFVRVNQFQGHTPLRASVTAALVDANESKVIFAVDGIWDVGDPETRAGFEHFVVNRLNDCPETALKIELQSPNNLFGFVAYQMTTAWKQAIVR